MTLRDQRQKEFADVWFEKGKHGILNLCPRFGKIRTTINILQRLKEELGRGPTVLISYPDNAIQKSWINDFDEYEYLHTDSVTYTTHLSLNKHSHKNFDIVIIDEIHLLSDNQISVCKKLFESNNNILGLTGTLSKYTEINLEKELDIHVLAEYPMEQGVKEGVIVDYDITVIRVPLDGTTIQRFGKKMKTEKLHYKHITYIVDKLTYSGSDSMFMRLARMRILQNSIAKIKKTKEILQQYPNDRILVFCGTTKAADSLGIASHHSKVTKKQSQSFQDFIDGDKDVNHLSVVKIGNTGVTYKNLNRVIINYFDSNSENLAQKINRCMAMEFDNPEKKAHIYIISTTEKVELNWLKKALEFFDESKIRYI